jgi:hypothetical protein
MPDVKPTPTRRPPPAKLACDDQTVAVRVHAGSPKVRPHVVPISGKTAPLTKQDLITSFIVVWQPQPPPPPLWIRFLQEAPFGTQLIRAQDLRWDGKFLSIELLNEPDIEAYAAQMPNWVDYANTAIAQCEKSPAVLALKEAEKRAAEIENRLRR